MKKFFMAAVLAAAVTCAVVAWRRGCCGGEAESGEGGCSCGCE